MHETSTPLPRRPESEEGATGLVWDREKGRWESEDAALSSSQLTAVGESPKEEAEQGKGNEPIWIEWDGPNDPGNPFNVSNSLRGWSELAVASFVGSRAHN